MAQIYYEQDVDIDLARRLKIGVIGYGSQGPAHALNLKDSGCQVVVALRPGSPSRARAEDSGLEVVTTMEAVENCDVLCFCTPDVSMPELYSADVAPLLREGQLLVFVHGFNIHYRLIVPPVNVDVVMVAPKAVGPRLRQEFKLGRGAPALAAVQQDWSGSAMQRTLAYAWGIGCAQTGILESSFKEETETDLFGEQAVLCGGLSALVKAGFETLVEAGYQPEAAYFECLHELKLIIDLVYEGGLNKMRESISDTAEWGDYTAGPQVIGCHTKEAMRKLLGKIQSGQFAREWVEESLSGGRAFLAKRDEERVHPIEKVGERLRAMMALGAQKEDD